jgi:hypothetical protein
MRRSFLFLVSCLAALPALARADETVPATLMTTCGELLVDQQFELPLPPFDGKSNGFASGFKGWRYNSAPRGGNWEVKDGAFIGTEDPKAHHPATASYGFDFKDVVIQCEVRMDNAPLNGRTGRSLSVRTTDTKDYVCSIIINPGGFRIQKDDNDHAGPDKPVPLGKSQMPLKLDEWIKVCFEIKGGEMVGTVNGRSLTGNHPLIGSQKHSVMFVCGVQGSVRNFRVWKALPNPDWEQNKARISAEQAPEKAAR